MEKTIELENNAELWQKTLIWQPNSLQNQQFEGLYQLILAANQQMNLTRITAPDEFWEKHLWDSLRGVVHWLSDPLSTSLRAIDIGTGAGLPGIAVAIALPNWQVTLLDSTRKKINFLQSAIAQLDLENVVTLTARAEEIGQQQPHREAYDLALLRAVGSPTVCAEYALPLLKIGGLAVLYRGVWSDAETETLNSATSCLGGVIASVESFTTPMSDSHRTCIQLRKVKHTPTEFPRSVGIPSQKPL
ncbi:16S rRNA (guanine(527)-N(7))-methyltransferase RsmG [Merismopedia glauca]|uniref:Ribosomal RNA small subunit methyltransferase G n=1 Tax=Merismopedia glauca CCAP 1448/3 TaxID=1296344 RepID=A0A2T1C0U8_9CYAN|nr:16S rRNA (guanine(527)-N(7))-methyltransferase RsmG [Merismopedia glauca]PSB01824.1 16S rRNA (guanine(527)-N(7))-methyltransferase RsmG [Merismopedia glauca CCAP 1448/3]